MGNRASDVKVSSWDWRHSRGPPGPLIRECVCVGRGRGVKGKKRSGYVILPARDGVIFLYIFFPNKFPPKQENCILCWELDGCEIWGGADVAVIFPLQKKGIKRTQWECFKWKWWLFVTLSSNKENNYSKQKLFDLFSFIQGNQILSTQVPSFP